MEFRVIALATATKKSTTKCRREISVVTCAEIPRALRLCRELDSHVRQEQAQNETKSMPPKAQKTTTLSIAYTLAGAPGLEPGNGGIKNRPNNLI
jgi:hypothetical protein